MGSYTFFSSILYFFLLATLVTSSPLLSYDIFDSGTSNGRSLLEAKKACTVGFKSKNYTVLTSQCKAPEYHQKICCDAFKEFACPFADNINDMTTNCAEDMFNYINFYGKYPPGLFAYKCKEGKQGLRCPALKNSTVTVSKYKKESTSSSVFVAAPTSIVIVSFVCLLDLFYILF